MRNLIQYPITLQEKLDALDWAIAAAEREEGESVGSTLSLSLREARRDLELTGTRMPADQPQIAT
jgi:hypothetical protein